ncbi:hypothetical protein VTN02DRAFT_6276 [Thermoascus thermophilus]
MVTGVDAQRKLEDAKAVDTGPYIGSDRASCLMKQRSPDKKDNEMHLQSRQEQRGVSHPLWKNHAGVL